MVRRSKDLVDLFRSTPGRNLAENGPEPAVASLKATGLAEAPSARRSRREAGETSDPPDAEALLAPDPLQTLPAGLSGSPDADRRRDCLNVIQTTSQLGRHWTLLAPRPSSVHDPNEGQTRAPPCSFPATSSELLTSGFRSPHHQQGNGERHGTPNCLCSAG